MQRGDVVWARVVFPHTWWPGLVTRIDALGVLVSFFDIHPSRYFISSELRSFDTGFRFPLMLRNINSDDDEDELFIRALEVFGLRTIRSLTCPCQRRNGSGSMDLRRAKSFRAVGVLEFVLRMGMSPWVEKADFVEAIGAVAQVQAFRGYRSAKQRSTYKGQKQRRGSEKKNLVSHEWDILEPEDESQLFFEEGDDNLADVVTNKTDLDIPISRESYNEHRLAGISVSQIKQRKAQSINEMLVNLHCLALNPFYCGGKCLNTVKQNILRFRNLSFQKVTGICLKTCLQSEGIEAQVSHPGFVKSEQRMKEDRRQNCGEIFSPSVSYTDNSVHCLGLKRKVDQPSASSSSHKLHKTMLGPSYQQINENRCRANSTDSFISGPALFDPSLHGYFDGIGKFQEPEESFHVSMDTRACTTYVNMQETGKSATIWGDYNGVHDEDVKVDCTFRSLRLFSTFSISNYIMGTQVNVIEVDSTLVAKRCLSHSDLASDKIKELPGDGQGTTSIRLNNEACISVNLGDSFKENKELYHPVASNSSFQLQRDQQLEDFPASTSLHMKFPRDFKLPSEEEVVKEFSPFGLVDSVRTKIFSYTGAAQVGFLHPADALAAYKYAKENRALFGEANMRFWLDPLEHRRRRIQSPVPSRKIKGKAVNPESCQPFCSHLSLKPQRGAHPEALASIAASTSLHMKFPKDFKPPPKEDLVKVFSPFGPVDSLKTKIFYYTDAAQVVFLHPSDASAAYQYVKENKLLFGEATIRFWLDPLEHMRGSKFTVPSASSTEKPACLKTCPPVGPNSSPKSQSGKQLKAFATPAASVSLKMKFPKDFKVPSKQELVKKFRPFGTIDIQRTKVSCHKAAAVVVFLCTNDAAAAYKYAKKKRSFFGGANIRFWLDPLEHRSRGTNFVVPSPSSTGKPVNLKSCLRKTNPLENKDKKKPYKVRFLIEK